MSPSFDDDSVDLSRRVFMVLFFLVSFSFLFSMLVLVHCSFLVRHCLIAHAFLVHSLVQPCLSLHLSFRLVSLDSFRFGRWHGRLWMRILLTVSGLTLGWDWCG